MILEELIHRTPENLPKFVNDLKTSLSKSQQPQPSTSQLPSPKIQSAPPKEVSPRVNPPQETQSPKSPVIRDNRPQAGETSTSVLYKLQSCPSNPAFDCTINPKYQEVFARKESAIPTFGIRIQSLLENSNISNNNVHETIIPEFPPWTLHRPKVNLHHIIYMFKNSMKLKTSTPIAQQFILMDPKTMTGLDVQLY